MTARPFRVRSPAGFAACAALAIAAAGCGRQAAGWRPEPSMLHARAAHAVVATDDAIYVLAGTGTGAAPVLAVERFDGTAWTDEAELPGDGLNAPAAVVLEGRVWLIGGFSTTTNVPVADVYTYDPRARTWDVAAPLPAPRGGHAAVVLDGRIHVLGGGNSERTLDDHSVFDPATGAWTEAARLPRSEGSPAAVALDGRIWCLGGRSGFSDFGDVYVWDPRTDAWTSGPAIDPRGTSGAVAWHGEIWLFGGESQARKACLADVLRLDPRAGRWEPGPPLPTARNYARAVVLRDTVYTVGGSLQPGHSHSSLGSTVVESLRR